MSSGLLVPILLIAAVLGFVAFRLRAARTGAGAHAARPARREEYGSELRPLRVKPNPVLDGEGVEVEGRIVRASENVGGLTCTVEAEAEVDGRRLSFEDSRLSVSLIRTTTDGISLRPGSTIRIRYLPTNPKVFAFVAASKPTADEVESEARDLRWGAALSLLFAAGALTFGLATDESKALGVAALALGIALLIWLKARYVAP